MRFELVDLFGAGLPTVLEFNGQARYWRNRGNFSKERLLHLLYPINGVRCAASQAKARLSTECNDSLFVAVGIPILAIALGRITTAQHLLNHTADPLILWVMAQETRKLSATVHDFSGTIMHALLPKAYRNSASDPERSA